MRQATCEWVRQWQWHLQQALAQSEQLRKRVEELEARMQHLEGKLDRHKPLQIETINYKVQELHVQELSGTLVAGLSALANGEAVQQWLGEEGASSVQLSDLEGEMQMTKDDSQ